MTTETINQRADRLVRQEVFLCVSGVVATLARGFGGIAAVAGESSLAEICDQAAELAAPVLDYEEAAREAGWRPSRGHAGRWVREGMPRNVADPQEACGLDNIEPHEHEVFEHWAVSAWLAEKLEAKGEKVDRDFASWNVWARTTSGQAISIDAVIQEIAREVLD